MNEIMQRHCRFVVSDIEILLSHAGRESADSAVRMINTFNDEVIDAAVFKQQADNDLSGAMSSSSFTHWVEPLKGSVVIVRIRSRQSPQAEGIVARYDH
jgi:hypothetical protein